MPRGTLQGDRDPMRINPNQNQISSLSTQDTAKSKSANKTKAYSNANEASHAVAAERSQNNSALISSKAKDMAKAKQAAIDTPDVREAKIQELKNRIQSGQYKVSAEQVADRLVDDHLQLAGA